MRPGDLAFFYHSNCEDPGIVGIVTIDSLPRPDHTAFDKNNDYYDPKSDPDNPRWYLVDVRFKKQLKRLISLQELRQHRQLKDMKLLQKGSRLSIMPLTENEWEFILSLE